MNTRIIDSAILAMFMFGIIGVTALLTDPRTGHNDGGMKARKSLAVTDTVKAAGHRYFILRDSCVAVAIHDPLCSDFSHFPVSSKRRESGYSEYDTKRGR